MEATSTQPRPLIALDRDETFRICDNGIAWVIEERKNADELYRRFGKSISQPKPKRRRAANRIKPEYAAALNKSRPSIVCLRRPALSSKLFKTCMVQEGSTPEDEIFEWTDKASLVQAIASTCIQVDRDGRKSLTAFWDSYADYRRDCETFGFEAVLMHLERRIIYARPMDEVHLLTNTDDSSAEDWSKIHPAFREMLQYGGVKERAWIQEILAIERKKKS